MTVAGTKDARSRQPHEMRVPDGQRHLLLISYHFPPSREVGAVRWQQLAKFAAEREWTLDVVTLDPASVVAPDWTALHELPPGVRVHGVPEQSLSLDRLVYWFVALRRRLLRRTDAQRAAATPVPGRPQSVGVEELKSPLHSPRDAVRAFHAWRSYVRQHTWSQHAAHVALRLLRAGRYRGVITCGPPHLVHDAGRALQRRTGVPFIVDMRDPWSLSPRIQEEIASPLTLRLARRHERRVVQAAALIVTNTEQSCSAMRAAYPAASERVIAILNGYDEDPVPPQVHGPCFVIAYAGSIYLDRDPRPLLRAVARVIHELGVRPDQLRLEFMGVEVGPTTALRAMADEERVGDFVLVHAGRPRADAQRFLARAALLVSLPLVSLAPATDTSIPAKIFEYARFKAWLLALANPESATAQFLRGTGADVVSPGDVDAIAAVIRARYSAFATGARPEHLRLPERFSRRAQAQLLFDELERRLPARHASPP